MKPESKMNWWVRSTNDCTTMSYFKQLFILAFVVTECISISVFVVIVSSKVAMKTCPNTASIKMQKSIITKRRKK